MSKQTCFGEIRALCTQAIGDQEARLPNVQHVLIRLAACEAFNSTCSRLEPFARDFVPSQALVMGEKELWCLILDRCADADELLRADLPLWYEFVHIVWALCFDVLSQCERIEQKEHSGVVEDNRLHFLNVAVSCPALEIGPNRQPLVTHHAQLCWSIPREESQLDFILKCSKPMQEMYMIAADPSLAIGWYDFREAYWKARLESPQVAIGFGLLSRVIKALKIGLQTREPHAREPHAGEAEDILNEVEKDIAEARSGGGFQGFEVALSCLLSTCRARIVRRPLVESIRQQAASQACLRACCCQHLDEAKLINEAHDLGPRIHALVYDALAVQSELDADQPGLQHDETLKLRDRSVVFMHYALRHQLRLGITADSMCVLANLCRMRFKLELAQTVVRYSVVREISQQLDSIEPMLELRLGYDDGDWRGQDSVGGAAKTEVRIALEQHLVRSYLLSNMSNPPTEEWKEAATAENMEYARREVEEVRERIQAFSKDTTITTAIPDYQLDALKEVATARPNQPVTPVATPM